MKNEFELAFNEVLEDKQLPKEVIMEAIQAAMVSAYRRAVNASNAQHVDAEINPETGDVRIFAEKEVVDTVEDERTEVDLKEARKVDPDAELGSMIIVESTPENFGRVAAQTARQVIQQRIREAERDAQLQHYSAQVGEILSGVIQAINNRGITLGLDLKAEGLMPRNQMIPGERFRVHDRVRALLLEVKPSSRGPQIILSRSHKNFLRRLLENEVPEIYHGMVEIRSISREPGHRSKVAVSALQPGVDPVGACVGIRGVRIQAIVRELNDEKIDVIEWNPDPAIYIAKALSPARVAGVYLNEFTKGTKTATVVVPEDQLSLAIGRDGQNARLAAKLTSWRIDIKSLPEAATDALYKIQTGEAEFVELIKIDKEIIQQVELILAKKSEGRPVTPEEYQVLSQFIDGVERGIIRISEKEYKADEEREQVARAGIPESAFEIPLSDFKISDRVYAVISETGLDTVGDLMLRLSMDPDSIFALSGMGPKAWKELNEAVEQVREEIEAREAEALQAEPAEELVEVDEEALEEALEEGQVISPKMETAEPDELEAVSESIEGEEIQEETLAEAETVEIEAAEVAVEEPTSEVAEAERAAESLEMEAEAEGELEVTPAIEEEVEEEAEEEAEEEEETLEELFSMEFSDFEYLPDDEEFEEDEEGDDRKGTRKRKRKKRKKFVEMEYDPDHDVMVVKKKRKRGDEEWEEDW